MSFDRSFQETPELLDMLLSALTIPEYRDLRESCANELRRRGILIDPVTPERIETLYGFQGESSTTPTTAH